MEISAVLTAAGLLLAGAALAMVSLNWKTQAHLREVESLTATIQDRESQLHDFRMREAKSERHSREVVGLMERLEAVEKVTTSLDTNLGIMHAKLERGGHYATREIPEQVGQGSWGTNRRDPDRETERPTTLPGLAPPT